MGLSVRGYKNIVMQPESVVFDEEGEWEEQGYIQFYSHHYFKNWIGNIDISRAYLAEEEFKFSAGSYSSYNDWRSLLAKMAGYGNTDHPRINNHYGVNNETSGPFWELINFSDCEGVIGSATCQKLLKDFEEYDSLMKQVDYYYFYETYENFKRAFQFGAENGAVKFS